MLKIRGLRVEFLTYGGVVRAVDIEELSINNGEFLGLVGETGCGKTVTSLAVCGLVSGKGRVAGGEILLDGEDLLKKPASEMRKIRGKKIAMIFQDPISSLNPVFTVGDMVTRIIQKHSSLDKEQALLKAVEALRVVRLPEPERILRQFPHELSGGMCQRVMIAMALSCEPRLLIADEPTTALDVTIAAQILDLLRDLREQVDMSVLMITHNLGVVAEICDRVAVMYAGHVVEVSPTAPLFENAFHPYTHGLMRAVPGSHTRGRRLNVIEGTVPNLADPPPGCRFHPRCPRAVAVCAERTPILTHVGDEHYVACHLASQGKVMAS